MTFEESQLQFTFNEEWSIRRYDAHPYYQGLSSAGLKGMDFIGIFQKKELVLFEVKNFRVSFQGRRPDSVQLQLRQPELLAKVMVQKVEDTLLGIQAIRQYLDRILTYQLFGRFFRKGHWAFWTQAQLLMEENLQIVFWLELEEEEMPFEEEVFQRIRAQLPELAQHIHLANHKRNPFPESLRVNPS